MTAAQERLGNLLNIVETERATLVRLEGQKENAQDEITSSEEAVAELRENLTGLHEALEEKTKSVEQVKRSTMKASKFLDQALKEISSKVGLRSFLL